jgi:tetratricopeptide (TPR) repeat protein
MTIPSERLAALIELDQSHSDTFGVKFRLGELYLALGQLDVAAVYLRSAHGLDGKRGVPVEAARSANLEYARALLLQGKAAEALSVVMPAARAGDSEALLVRARAYVQSGNTKAAIADFQSAWERKDAHRSAADYTLYAQALGAETRYVDGLKTLTDCEVSLGYQPGTGLLESSLLEKLGMTTESVLAAFKETLYQQSQGTISIPQIYTNLGVLSSRSDVAGVVGVKEQALIRGLKAYLNARWSDASGELKLGLKGVDYQFARFLLLSCSLEKDKVTASLLTDYAGLEGRYRSFPAYYYHLWRALKKGPGDYTLANVRNVLEKTILLAPGSDEARETRVELGRLMGVEAADARYILLRPELEVAFARLLGGIDPQTVLPPVLRLLSVRRENVYTSDGMLMLKSAIKAPAVASYLADQAGKASGALKDRLLQLL